ncbi:MAG: creatininase family protein [Myxococcota bacterium]|nr:creatininase family protein [Myxococcota bacterium]
MSEVWSTRVDLSEMTYEEAREVIARGAIALLPTGATEAHGPHLPLSTDVVISREAARRAHRLLLRDGVPAIVLPALAYAVTDYASEFSGTISLPFDTAKALVRDVILGAMRTGFRGVVICNAHLEPENLRALREGAEEARARGARVEFPDVTRKPHALRLGEEFKSGACHAGSYETSLVLAADPFLVRTERAESLAPNPTSLSRAIRDGKKTFLEAGGAHAYFGDPSAGNAAEGELLYTELSQIFATAATTLGTGSRP